MSTKTHEVKDTIVLYPAPGIGHLVSMVELGKLILNHHSNKSLSITILLTTGFLDTPAIAPYIRRVAAAFSAISFRRFPFQPVDAAPPRSRAATAFEFIRLNRPNVVRALREISGAGTVRAFVIDLFCSSALDAAREVGNNVPTYYFFTSGAAVLAAFLHLPTVHERVSASFKDLNDVVLDFPGMSRPLKATHMPEPTLDRDDPSYWDFLSFCSDLSKSDGIIVNTFDALEPIPIAGALAADGVCVPGMPAPTLYCIGPLIAEANQINPEDADSSISAYLSWLDLQPSRSVVFLCFGSRGSFPAAQVREIAAGLERSGQRFVWVVKKPPSQGHEKTMQTEDVGTDYEWDAGLFPDGFLERTRGRGMVVKSWAPQVAVLAKEAVGGFVTHCGWNSVLEAVAAGVPMVAWPLYAEQHVNRNVMVHDLRIAVAVEQREGDGFVSGDEVERAIKELMESESGQEVRRESLKMRNSASTAWGQSGSSAAALDKFVSSIIV